MHSRPNEHLRAKGIEFQNVTKRFGKVTALDNLALEVPAGIRLVLLGSSGCGKTTALRLIAGLEKTTEGSILIGGINAVDLPPDQRGVAMVFQDYALYPHMTVEGNLTFGLKAKRMSNEIIKHRMQRALEMLELENLNNRKPHELSGGQRQRVALARAIVKEAPIILMDEPLSNLDARLRAQARKDLVHIHEETGSTMVYVTHDQTEAMAIGQLVAVFEKGKLLQIGSPMEIYRRPANAQVARFIGSPPMNLLPATVSDDCTVLVNSSRLDLPEDWRKLLPVGKKEMLLGIRPENIIVNYESHSQNPYSPVTLRWMEVLGKETIFYIKNGKGPEIAALSLCERNFLPGENLFASFSWTDVHFFDSETGASFGYPEKLKI